MFTLEFTGRTITAKKWITPDRRDCEEERHRDLRDSQRGDCFPPVSCARCAVSGSVTQFDEAFDLRGRLEGHGHREYRRDRDARFRELLAEEALASGVRPPAIRHVVRDAQEVFELRDGVLVPRDGRTEPGDPLAPVDASDVVAEPREDGRLFVRAPSVKTICHAHEQR